MWPSRGAPYSCHVIIALTEQNPRKIRRELSRARLLISFQLIKFRPTWNVFSFSFNLNLNSTEIDLVLRCFDDALKVL
ncbi:hypothetical protein K2173_010001 [Erythroxylum novogranatense]|uniref:Uncharacterized protein n=1 Tax=Erythroxylum novogranatense TaxID=1862640 RepID=A0AAV8T0Y8_9ROSI|nr:hypothetical protein K2173_010001 [Erythroxylum novogranatense]